MAADVRHALPKGDHPLPNSWSWVWFTDVMDVEGGTQPPASEFIDEPRPGYVRLVQIRDFESDGHITFIPDSPKWRKCGVADVLIGRYGAALGRICTGLEGAYNVALAKVIPSDRVHVKFAYYLLKSEYFQAPLLASGGRSAQAGFNKGGLSVIPLPLPPLDEQRAIAHILGSLDDKIELNRRMSETLEAMARALFKSWFVDFDPVRAKAEGRDPGLPKPLADLFPARLVDSELGEIPEGWAVRPLRDLAGYLSRGIGPAYVETGGICVLNQKCIRDRRIDFSKARRHDPEKKSGDGRLLQRLDVLVNSTGVGTLGRAAQLWHLPEPAIVDSHVTVLRAASGVTPWFLGVAVTGREDEIEALGEGSTGQTELSRIRLGDLPCIVPSKGLQTRFGGAAERLLGRLSSSQRESENLALLRDALLPKLVSGELRVRDAERIAAGIAG